MKAEAKMSWSLLARRVFWRLRALLAPEPAGSQAELLRLMVRAGRRCAHDLQHAASDISVSYRHTPEDREALTIQWSERARLWQGIFYPVGGLKDYRDELHAEIEKLGDEVKRLKTLCLANGINPHGSEDMPF